MKKTLHIPKFLCRLLLFIACCTTANQAFSQYQSFFGEEKTTYHIYSRMTCYSDNEFYPYGVGGCSGTLPFDISKEDTLVRNDTIYYKASEHGFVRLLIREDTVSGKLFRYIEELNREFLICDMSLSVGDTFTLPIFADENGNAPNDFYYLEEGINFIVDSITYMSEKKVLHLSCTEYMDISIFEYGYFNFIEGIGPAYGPFGYVSVSLENYLSLLLCVEKDDTLSYKVFDECDYHWAKVKEEEKYPITLFPNPTETELRIILSDPSFIGNNIIITDISGRMIDQIKMQEMRMVLDVSPYAQGVYFLNCISEKEKYSVKFVKK